MYRVSIVLFGIAAVAGLIMAVSRFKKATLLAAEYVLLS
jgi:hypothetical protein